MSLLPCYNHYFSMERKLLQMRNNYNSSQECISAQAFVWGNGDEGQLGLGDKR
jgi:hypothetical protein